jgi:hypothetical protein
MRTYVAALVGVALLGAAIAFALLRPTAPAVVVPPIASAPLDAASASAPIAAAAADAAPVVLPPLVVEHARTEPPRPRTPRPPRESRAPKAPPASASPERVEAKFRAVRKEYAEFKKAYGSRLEPEWNAVLFLVTYGKADKYERLDGMIDKLRGEMAKVRRGAE